MTSRREALARVPLFARATPEQLTAIEGVARPVQHPNDTVLFFEGDRGDAMYVVLSGGVAVSRSHDDGRSTILGSFGPGEIVGELAILDDAPRSATATTTAASELLSVGRNDFRELVGKQPEILWRVVEALCARVRESGARQMALVHETVPYRVVDCLVQLAEKHGTTDANGLLTYEVRLAAVAQGSGTDDRAARRVALLLEQKGLVTLRDDLVTVTDTYSLGRAREYAREWS